MTTSCCKKNTYYEILDLCKFVCAIFVLLIHCNVFEDGSVFLSEVYTNGILRIAVPFFYCISGFLLTQIEQNYGVNGVKRYAIKNIKVYILWSLIYITFHLLIDYFIHKSTMIDVVFKTLPKEIWNTIFRASSYQFWYILALIYAIPIVYVMLNLSDKLKVIVAGFLWICQCFAWSYTNMFPKWGVLFAFSQTIDAVWNTIFCAVPLLLVGSLAYNTHQKKTAKLWTVGFVSSTMLLFLEKIILIKSPINNGRSWFLLMTPVCAFFLLNMALSYNKNVNGAKKMREYSLYIYCIHPIVIVFVNKFCKSKGCALLFVLIGTLLVAYFCILIKSFIFRRKSK